MPLFLQGNKTRPRSFLGEKKKKTNTNLRTLLSRTTLQIRIHHWNIQFRTIQTDYTSKSKIKKSTIKTSQSTSTETQAIRRVLKSKSETNETHRFETHREGIDFFFLEGVCIVATHGNEPSDLRER